MNVSFFDSNIFIYLFDEKALSKQVIADALVREALLSNKAIISFQVIQECLNTLTRKLKVNSEDVRRFMNAFLLPLWHVMPSQELYTRALNLQTQTKYSFYDSLIIAATLEGGCITLYSEDLQHGQQIERLIIQNPFIDT